MTAKQDRCRKWYAKNREKVLAKRRKYVREHAAEVAEYNRRYRSRPEVKARRAAQMREWYAAHREEHLALCHSWRERNREHYLAMKARWHGEYRAKLAADPAFRKAHQAKRCEICRKHRAKVGARCAVDAAYYAEQRARRRIIKAMRRVRCGGKYRPRLNCRVPDWCVKGQRILDARSAFLDMNLTPSQRAWLKERTIESKNWRER